MPSPAAAAPSASSSSSSSAMSNADKMKAHVDAHMKKFAHVDERKERSAAHSSHTLRSCPQHCLQPPQLTCSPLVPLFGCH